jgi:hypothetical protein
MFLYTPCWHIGERRYSSVYYYIETSGQLYAPMALPLINWTRGLVAPRTCLDTCEGQKSLESARNWHTIPRSAAGNRHTVPRSPCPQPSHCTDYTLPASPSLRRNILYITCFKGMFYLRLHGNKHLKFPAEPFWSSYVLFLIFTQANTTAFPSIYYYAATCFGLSGHYQA